MKDALEELDNTLGTLKDFQSATVSAVMESFNSGKSNRVLVADEVGLGKTIVAKGVIAELLKARLIQSSWLSLKQPFRVTYICSNLTLAEENRKKLAVFTARSHDDYVQEPTFKRLLDTALVPANPPVKTKLLEVCTLTPSTSFNPTRGQGNWEERAIIYAALIEHPELEPFKRKLSNFFSDNLNNWVERRNHHLHNKVLNQSVIRHFHTLLRSRISEDDIAWIGFASPYRRWIDLLLEFVRGDLRFDKSVGLKRFRTAIRSLLARACAKELTADLFILDEFQRFKSLLDSHNDNDDALVAREIFDNQSDCKILLLSATPFKAVTRIEDDEDGDAHAAELQYLLDFLTGSDKPLMADYDASRRAIQQQIMALRDSTFDVHTLKDDNRTAIELLLAPYICRTERAQISNGYDDLFSTQDLPCGDEFSIEDIKQFQAVDQLGQKLKEAYPSRTASQIMDFYKAAPWPLSFLSGYQFKIQLDKHKDKPLIRKAMRKSRSAWLSRLELQNYQLNMEKAPHAKSRALIKKLFSNRSEELLWVPPSLPRYPLVGSFSGQQAFSKSLLFSSWAMVPRALSGLVSYEAERRLLVNQKGVEKAYHKSSTHSPKIKFDEKTSLAGWSLVYPSKSLMVMDLPRRVIDLTELLLERQSYFSVVIEKFRERQVGGRADDRWYGIMPFLLDKADGHEQYVTDWVKQQQRGLKRQSGDSGRFKQLTSLAAFLELEDKQELGMMPNDLARYLAYLSIAGPAVAMARTFRKNWPDDQELDIARAATDVAFAVVAMFNKPESESIINKLYSKQKYYVSVAQYCVEGDFQAVMDEYVHLLRGDNLSLAAEKGGQTYSVVQRLVDVMGFRTSSVDCQFRESKNQSSASRHTLRCHYAVPLGNQKISDEKSSQRMGNVRDAFNSPFRPFLLNSTSIGQEGLDFHWYCHNIIHWNLPGNPIDIEQREGRVNRYKSHLVRKRLTEQMWEKLGDQISCDLVDTWSNLFRIAEESTREHRSSDLEPYWHIPMGTAKIERFVPMMPLSREVARLDNALKILVLYRLAFGQPRQEELLDNLLHRNFSEADINFIKKQLVINLAPLSRTR